MSWFGFDVLVVLFCYALIVSMLLIGKWLANKGSSVLCSEITSNRLTDISVVIPYRNEMDNIPNLLQCIEELTMLPGEFIFVNDHSDDDSMDLIQKFQFSCRVNSLSLNVEQEGKKAALSTGIKEAKGKFVLTWDADIVVLPDFFKTLLEYKWSDLCVLPVQMKDSSFVGGFFAWDYQLQTQASLALSGIIRPISASGANLFFEKQSYLDADEIRDDAHFSSGDDQFLLSAFRRLDKKIEVINDPQLIANTAPPRKMVAGINQRSRWLGKSRAVKDKLANGFGFTVFIIQLSYYFFTFYQLCIGNFGTSMLMILIKSELDAFICTYKFQEQFNTVQVFLYELVFPFYIFILGFNSVFGKTIWKNRPNKVKRV